VGTGAGRQGRRCGGGGWFDDLTMITLSMSKGHPHPSPLPARERGGPYINIEFYCRKVILSLAVALLGRVPRSGAI